MSIKVLSKDIIEKIAAGEVVERPSSVVKEMVENAIDAGATNITVEIERGGTKYIRITDNGCGMAEEDARLCFLAHATSKISSGDDLFSIGTLGFRGEALSSISAVGKVTLYTRRAHSEYAIKLVCHGGEVLSTEACGRPEGTTMIVEDLFYNVPARLKFLKKPATEGSYISGILQKYILARPDISFRYISDGKDVYFSRGDNSLKNAIYTIYGKEVYSNLLPVDFTYDQYKITGYIGDPAISRGTKSMQNLFVNGRYIRSDAISTAVKQGFSNRIMPAKHPVFILNFNMQLDSVDVNVHPNKLDVRFSDEGMVQECFYKAIKGAFERNTALEFADENRAEAFSAMADEDISSIKNSVKDTVLETAKSKIDYTYEKPGHSTAKQSVGLLDRQIDYVQKEVAYNAPRVESNEPKTIEVVHESPKEESKGSSQTELQLDLSTEIGDYRIIGQLLKTYVLVEYKDSLLLIDQHAAHERLNTDKFLAQTESSNVLRQQLMIPVVVQLTAEDFSVAIESKDVFYNLGFEIEEFGNSTIRINSTPHIFGEGNPQQFFFETLDAIHKNPKMDTRKHIIFEMACKHSIKAGQTLSEAEIRELIRMSLEDTSPYNCPHGRPIVIIKKKAEIEKWFMRIV